MKYFLQIIFVLSFFVMVNANGQISGVEKGMEAITADALKAQLGFLSSDWMEGREAGEKGEYMAADYIAGMLRLYGVKPAGDYQFVRGPMNNMEKGERTYFQNFILLKTLPGEEQVLKIKSTEDKTVKSVNLTWNVDFSLYPSDRSIEIDAPVVFVGYGYINDSLKYNDFSRLDVKGKFILKIAGLPKFIGESPYKDKSASIRGEMELRYKALGAIGILEYDPDAVVTGRPERKDFMNMSPAEGVPSQGKPHARFTIPGKKNADNLIRITLSARSASEILTGTGIDAESYRNKSDKNEKFVIPELKDRSVYLKSTVKTSQVSVRNILGIVEGKNPGKYIVLGAHYDHMGMGNGYIWNGADDNGSGTVGVMTIARAIMATGEKPETSIIFALWTSEEEGLLGSRYYVRNLDFPVGDLKLNMNFDMISRYISDDEPRKVTMTYTSSYPFFREITERNLEKYRIDLLIDYQPSADPPGGTDHRSFVEAGVPVIRLKPGHREEYHTPKDEIGTVNWDIMEKIIKICFADTWDLASGKW
jgi:hypothetical protein